MEHFMAARFSGKMVLLFLRCDVCDLINFVGRRDKGPRGERACATSGMAYSVFPQEH